MTIRKIELELILMVERLLTKESKPPFSMAELGNQRLVTDGFDGPAKKYFLDNKLYSVHVSMDLNGLDGSVIVDLSKPIPSKYFDMFNVVTNAGTTEHITDGQFAAFQNIHDMTTVGGYMIHSIPAQGCWRGHCPHHYSNNFIKALAKDNGYDVIFSDLMVRRREEFLVAGIVKKLQHKPFVCKTWDAEISRTNNYKKNTDNLK